MEKSKVIGLAKNPGFYELDNRLWLKKELAEKYNIEIGDEIEYEIETWETGKKVIKEIVKVNKGNEYDEYFNEFEKIEESKDLKKKYFDNGVQDIAKKLTNNGLSATKLRKYYQTFKQLVENNGDLQDYYLLKAQVNYDAGRGSKKEKQAMNEFKKYIEVIIRLVERVFENKKLLEYLKKHFEALIAYVTYYKK